MKTLILIRHAKSSWESDAPSDFVRPLASRGLRDAPRMGRWLCEWLGAEACTLSRVLSSPARRARQTVDLMLGAFPPPRPKLVDAPELYMASQTTLRHVAESALADTDSVALVAHNPGLDSFLDALCPTAPLTDKGKLMTTANVAVITLAGDQCVREYATLRALKRPRELG